MKAVTITAGVALMVGAAVLIFTDAQVIGPIMLLLLVVVPLLGVLITVDDDLPGGFSNPTGKLPGPWTRWENWADLTIRVALCGIGFAIDNAWRSQAAIIPWIIGICAMAVLVVFGRRIYRQVASNRAEIRR